MDPKETNNVESHSGPMERMRRTKKQLKVIAVSASVITVLAVMVCGVVIRKVLVPMNYYNHGVDLMYQGDYAGAITYFMRADGYKDSDEQIQTCELYLEEPDN